MIFFSGELSSVERGVERRRLAGAGRAGDEHHAGRAPDGMAHALENRGRHADAVEPEQAGALIEQTYDDRFAVLVGMVEYAHRRNCCGS